MLCQHPTHIQQMDRDNGTDLIHSPQTFGLNTSSSFDVAMSPPSYCSLSNGTSELQPENDQTSYLILDLGDVFFHWSARELTALSPSTFHACILSPAWGDYERGSIEEEQVLQIIGKELALEPATIQEALEQCRRTLRVDHELVNQLKQLKLDMGDRFKVFAMTNISRPDFARLTAALQSWDGLFDRVFTSFEAGMIKPELSFYEHVLDQINLPSAKTAVFVDDKNTNVMAARSSGLHGIVFESPHQLMRGLRNHFFDPITRGRQYMQTHARNHVSQIENGPEFRDVFSQFLIHEVFQDASIISISPSGSSEIEIQAELDKASKHAQTWNYFIGAPIGTTKTFPSDADDTAMALLAFHPPSSSAHPVLDEILANKLSSEGLIQVYFCAQRPRICPWVLTNVIRIFYQYNRASDVQTELAYVTRILLSRAYIDGSSAYPVAELFLYYLSRLVSENPADKAIQALRASLADACRERVGRRGDSVTVAARVLACQVLGVWAGSDVACLRDMQDVDGGWEIGWVCCFGRSKKRIGSRGVATALAVRALERDRERIEMGSLG